MRAALVPLKPLCLAKSRLSALLDVQQRSALVMAMAQDVVAALVASNRFDAIMLLTDDEIYRPLARRSAIDIWRANAGAYAEQAGGRLNVELRLALKRLHRTGCEHVLIVAGDVPTLQADDLQRLTREAPAGVRVCPASRDGGTNALGLTPPDAITVQFGDSSAARHGAEARRRGVYCASVPCPSMSRDVDLPDDVAWLARTTFPCRSRTIAAELLSPAVERRPRAAA